MNNKKNIVASILLVAGLVIFLIGFGIAGFDFSELSTEPPYINKVFETAEQIDSINIKTRDNEVTLIPSNDDMFHIDYNENGKDLFDISVVNGELRIIYKSSRKWYDYICNIKFDDQFVKIAIPEKFTGNIDMDTRNSEIFLDALSADTLTIDAANDEIELKNLTISGNLTVDNRNNRVTMENITANGQIYCKNRNAGIVLYDLSGKDIIADNRNGSIKCRNTVSEATIDLTTYNNTIALDSVDYGTKMICDNTNGDIEGTICGNIGDFSIEAYAKHGECNLPENLKSGDKILNLSTSNDDIDIEFINK